MLREPISVIIQFADIQLKENDIYVHMYNQ